MPNSNTFDIKPIEGFVYQWINECEGLMIDPFARNSYLADETNDLNPDTEAQFHMYATDFLEMMLEVHGPRSIGMIIFDPPYSMRQVKEVYEQYGTGKFTGHDSRNVGRWTDERLLCDRLLSDKGIFLQFGWSTTGMGKKYGFEIEEILLVAHGGAHHDTICMAERRVLNPQQSLFGEDNG
jgi:hypothetical protein